MTSLRCVFSPPVQRELMTLCGAVVDNSRTSLACDSHHGIVTETHQQADAVGQDVSACMRALCGRAAWLHVSTARPQRAGACHLAGSYTSCRALTSAARLYVALVVCPVHGTVQFHCIAVVSRSVSPEARASDLKGCMIQFAPGHSCRMQQEMPQRAPAITTK